MIFRTLFFSTFLISLAFAEPLENYLGWDLTKNTTESTPIINEDGSYTVSSRGDYYTLTPPDRRNPITVDAITASRLRAGQTDPERVYSGGGSVPVASQMASGGDALVPVGTFAPLDDLKTTAPLIEGGILAYPVAPPRQEGTTRSSSGNGGSIGSFGSTGVANSNVAKYAAASSAIPTNGFEGVSESAKELAAAQAAAAGSVGGGLSLERPNPIAPTEADKNFGNDVSKAQAEALGFKAPTDKDGKPIGALKPVDDFGGTVGGNRQMAGFGFNGNKEAKGGKEVYSAPAVCTGGSKVFDKPGAHRLSIPRGCTNLTIYAWGAGGGKGHRGGSGGGAAFSLGRTDFDGSQFDVVVVVGAAGASGDASKPGLGGFPGGGAGGASSIGPGGGGGGFSGVFKVHKSNRENIFVKENAILVAAGGGGGGGYSTMQTAFRGTSNSVGGNGGAGSTKAGANTGNGEEGESLLGGNGGDGNTVTSADCERSVLYGFGKTNNCVQRTNGFGGVYYSANRTVTSRNGGGGGGGGGFIGGGGGGSGGSGGGGGSCLAAPLVPILAVGKGTKPGYEYFPDRGRAGEAGQHGKVKVEF